MNETLTLSDGTQLAGHCIEADGALWVYLEKAPLGDLFPVLNDPEKTQAIRANWYGAETEYRGYNHLFCIREEIDQVNAGLRKK